MVWLQLYFGGGVGPGEGAGVCGAPHAPDHFQLQSVLHVQAGRLPVHLLYPPVHCAGVSAHFSSSQQHALPALKHSSHHGWPLVPRRKLAADALLARTIHATPPSTRDAEGTRPRTRCAMADLHLEGQVGTLMNVVPRRNCLCVCD